MKRLLALVMLLSLAFGAMAAQATEVKMSGDVRIYANWWDQYNFTGWNPTGTKTYDPLTIWERFRLRTDFIANEGLKFRLAIRVNDFSTTWGSGTFTVDNPAVQIQVYQAYLQFKWPSTNVEFTIGYQDLDLPMSVDWMGANPVFGGTHTAAAVVNIPVSDNFSAIVGFSRFLSGDANGVNSGWDASGTTTQTASDLDGYFLILPITLDGFKMTPWAMIGVAGREAAYGTFVGNGPNASESLASYLLSAGALTPRMVPGPNGTIIPATPSVTINGMKIPVMNYSIQHAQNAYWWIGSSFAVTALDPFKFYADIMYGAGMQNDYKKNQRAGWFLDLGAEYTGWDFATPQVSFWYSSGEDKSTNNGSERMPSVVNYWGPSNSFLFDTNQAFNFGYVPVNSVGSMGFVVALDKISFVKDLTHRIGFSYARGTNSPRALRFANDTFGVGNYVQMGRDLTVNESVYGINFDSNYNIFENLALILETGWAHGNFQSSVWNAPRAPFVIMPNGLTYGFGHSFTHAARNGDTWKVTLGLKYAF